MNVVSRRGEGELRASPCARVCVLVEARDSPPPVAGNKRSRTGATLGASCGGEGGAQERRELLDGHKGEMSMLFDKRSLMEQQYMEAMQEKAGEYHALLEAQRVQDAEEYNILKIRLETDIQNLEQHLEAMRATYQARRLPPAAGVGSRSWLGDRVHACPTNNRS